MNTPEILKSLIQGLYSEAIARFNFRIVDQQNSYLIAGDGQLLGRFSNRYDAESIFNQYGTYGSKYSPASIFNQYGTYGSKYSAYSPTNKYTQTPPKIYINGIFFGHLTVNKYVPNAVPPDSFLFYVMYRLNLRAEMLNNFLDFTSRLG